MQFDFRFDPDRPVSPDENWIRVGAQRVRFHFVRHRQARRYVLRLRPDGSARVTIPRGGSADEARSFAERNKDWLQAQLRRLTNHPVRPKEWLIGMEILFRGELVKIEAGVNGESGLIRFGTETIKMAGWAGDFRYPIERHLWRLAAN